MSDTLSKLPAILAAHGRWLRGEKDSSRADLSGADLRGADLRDANLNGADLRGADLRDAYLSDANLNGADLRGAYLRGAYLSDANLNGADLSGADLRGADLRRADLSGANLNGADLRGADLRDAYLRDAYLSGADLSGADLRDVKGLDPLPFGPVTLPDGAFRAYKLARGPRGERVIVTLEIPEDAARVAPLTGRKCRAARARVLALSEGESAKPWHNRNDQMLLTYRVGETVEADRYDPSPFVECSHGVHFFISRREAEEYER